MTNLTTTLQNLTDAQIKIIEAIYTFDCVTCECIQEKTNLELSVIRGNLQALNTLGLITNLKTSYFNDDVLYFESADYTFEELQNAYNAPVKTVKYYNEQGEEIFSPADQKKLNAIISKIKKAEARLYNAQMSNNLILASIIKSSISFLERQEKSFY